MVIASGAPANTKHFNTIIMYNFGPTLYKCDKNVSPNVERRECYSTQMAVLFWDVIKS